MAMSNDDVLLEVVCGIVSAANGSDDPRLLQLMDASVQLLTTSTSDLLPMLLLRYEALKKREENLEEELENLYEDNTLSQIRERVANTQGDF